MDSELKNPALGSRYFDQSKSLTGVVKRQDPVKNSSKLRWSDESESWVSWTRLSKWPYIRLVTVPDN